MSALEEIIKGSTSNALCFIVIGEKFQKQFEDIALPHFKPYCEKYGLGLLILKDYIDEKNRHVSPYSDDPGYQRLLVPEAVVNDFPQYKYICDLDVDCLPGPRARNIFDFPEGGLKGDTIYLTKPTPFDLPRAELGKRLSLLRNIYDDESFPLDSLLAGDDEFEKEALGFSFEGPIATMGTCMGSAQLIADCCRIAYDAIANNFSGYLQNYKNQIFREQANIEWLPYEFQAIWSYELAYFYPYLFPYRGNKKLIKDVVISTLLRVDMLHFAGSWPENNVFKDGPFLGSVALKKYYSMLPKSLEKDIIPKAYGKVRYSKKQ